MSVFQKTLGGFKTMTFVLQTITFIIRIRLTTLNPILPLSSSYELRYDTYSTKGPFLDQSDKPYSLKAVYATEGQNWKHYFEISVKRIDSNMKAKMYY